MGVLSDHLRWPEEDENTGVPISTGEPARPRPDWQRVARHLADAVISTFDGWSAVAERLEHEASSAESPADARAAQAAADLLRGADERRNAEP